MPTRLTHYITTWLVGKETIFATTIRPSYLLDYLTSFRDLTECSQVGKSVMIELEVDESNAFRERGGGGRELI